MSQGILIFEALWSHSDTPDSIGLYYISDQLDTPTSTWQHTTLTKEGHPCPGWYSNLQSQQACGCRTMPLTAWPLGSALNTNRTININITRQLLQLYTDTSWICEGKWYLVRWYHSPYLGCLHMFQFVCKFSVFSIRNGRNQIISSVARSILQSFTKPPQHTPLNYFHYINYCLINAKWFLDVCLILSQEITAHNTREWK
jgi:hypothetical protein